MNLDLLPKAGDLVIPGPSGNPPTGLRAFEVVRTDPSVAPGLARPVGSIAVLYTGGSAWLKYSTGATNWSPILSLGMLGTPTNSAKITTLLNDQPNLNALAVDYGNGSRLVYQQPLTLGAGVSEVTFGSLPWSGVRAEFTILGAIVGGTNAYLSARVDALSGDLSGGTIREINVSNTGALEATGALVGYSVSNLNNNDIVCARSWISESADTTQRRILFNEATMYRASDGKYFYWNKRHYVPARGATANLVLGGKLVGGSVWAAGALATVRVYR